MTLRKLVPLSAFVFVVALCATTVIALESCGGVDCKDPANAGNATCVAENALVTCAQSEIDQVIAAHPEIDKTIQSAKNADGSINWGGIAGQLESYAITFGACVIAAVIEHYIGNVASGSNATVTAKPDPARAMFDQIRAKHWPGKKYKLPSGVVL